MKEYPFKAVVFTDALAFHELPTPSGVRFVRFALDFETLKIPRNPCVVDFNHDSEQPIGSATLTVTPEAIIAEGVFVSSVEGDRAAQIAETGGVVPFGISPTLDLSDATLEEYPAGEVGAANGREYSLDDGGFVIIRGAALLGISVCPYATDNQTSLTPLKKEGVIKLSQKGIRIMDNQTQLANDQVEELAGDVSGVEETESGVRDLDLKTFIDEFGLEKGVDFFQRGYDLQTAQMEDYHALKAAMKEGSAASGGDAGEEGAASDSGADGGGGTATFSRRTNQGKIDSAIEDRLEALCQECQTLLAKMNACVVKLTSSRLTKLGAKSTPTEATTVQPVKVSYIESVIAAAKRR